MRLIFIFWGIYVFLFIKFFGVIDILVIFKNSNSDYEDKLMMVYVL